MTRRDELARLRSNVAEWRKAEREVQEAEYDGVEWNVAMDRLIRHRREVDRILGEPPTAAGADRRLSVGGTVSALAATAAAGVSCGFEIGAVFPAAGPAVSAFHLAVAVLSVAVIWRSTAPWRPR